MSSSSKQSLPSRFSKQNLIFCHLSHACYTPRPSHHPNNVRRTHILEVPIMQFSPFSRPFLPLRFKYSPQYPVLTDPQSTFCLKLILLVTWIKDTIQVMTLLSFMPLPKHQSYTETTGLKWYTSTAVCINNTTYLLVKSQQHLVATMDTITEIINENIWKQGC